MAHEFEIGPNSRRISGKRLWPSSRPAPPGARFAASAVPVSHSSENPELDKPFLRYLCPEDGEISRIQLYAEFLSGPRLQMKVATLSGGSASEFRFLLRAGMSETDRRVTIRKGDRIALSVMRDPSDKAEKEVVIGPISAAFLYQISPKAMQPQDKLVIEPNEEEE